MTRRTKLLILWCSLMAALFHFGIIGFYALRFNTKHPPTVIQQSYCDPFFHQDWKLFVPPPRANYRLLLPDEKGNYRDLLAELRQAHQHNRLAGKGHVLLAFINYIHVFEKSTNSRGGKITADPYFQLLSQAAQNYQRQAGVKTPTLSGLVLLVEEKNKSRLYFN
jgi:hypothetical protein